MTKTRLEAFSDGVIAILITIMVLEMKAPEGADGATWSALRPVLPTFLAYVLSFVYVGIYWNNHHHMLQMARRVNGRVLWANLHLLFWLSLVPFVTAWLGNTHFAALPAAGYGVVMLLTAVAYVVLQNTIIALDGEHSPLREAVGRDRKGKLSLALYAAAIPLAFVDPRISVGIYVLVAAMWLTPDQRIETRLRGDDDGA
jgi:uncharacterized membrane protein